MSRFFCVPFARFAPIAFVLCLAAFAVGGSVDAGPTRDLALFIEDPVEAEESIEVEEPADIEELVAESSDELESESPEALSEENVEEEHKGIVRRMYDWVVGWADTPYGTPALGLIAFAESSFFPIPPDVLQMALSVAKPRSAFFYAFVASICSILGGVFGWYIGFRLWSSCGDFFLKYIPGLNQELVDRVAKTYQKNAFMAILGAAFTPIPFKVFTIAAGISHVPLRTLLLASAIGRSGRFFLVAGAIYLVGPSVNELIDKYFGLVTLGFFVLLVGGFIVIKKFVKH